MKTKALTATCYTDEGVADKEYSGVTYKVTTTADKDSASNYKVATCTNAGVLTAKGQVQYTYIVFQRIQV